MKPKYLIFVLLCLSIINYCCEKKKDITGPSDDVPTYLFPFEVGRQWVFDAFETDTAGNTIPGRTGKSIMKILRSLELDGKQCFELVDSTKIVDSIDVEYNYFHVDEQGNLWQHFIRITDEPGVQRIKKGNVPQILGLGWLKIFNREIGLNQIHVVIDTIISMGEIPVRLQIQSMIRSRTSMTVPIGYFNDVYPGELEFQLSSGIIVMGYKFSVWLVPGVGFIKFKEPLADDFGQSIKGYLIKELRSKNF